jgi:hypothetical protein
LQDGQIGAGDRFDFFGDYKTKVFQKNYWEFYKSSRRSVVQSRVLAHWSIAKLKRSTAFDANIAQLAEHLPCKHFA